LFLYPRSKDCGGRLSGMTRWGLVSPLSGMTGKTTVTPAPITAATDLCYLSLPFIAWILS